MRPSTATLVLALTLGPFGCPRQVGESEADDGPASASADAQPGREDQAGQAEQGEAPTSGEPTPTSGEPTLTSDDGGDQGASPALLSGDLTADIEHSKVGFAVSRATTGHIGHFDRFDATLTLKDSVPTGLRINVDTGSVVADRQGLTSHLKSADFFHVAKFPTATFTATSFTPDAEEGPSTYQVEGTMHLHGVERKLTFPASIEIEADRVVGTATLEISAKAFGIDYEGMEQELAEDAVSLEIELLFPRVAAG